MKIIQPSIEFYGAVPTDCDNAIKFIEIAGRTCYKSENKITIGSAEKFVKKLINAQPTPHLAMVEHSNFVIRTKRMDASPMVLQGRVGKFLNVFHTFEYTYIGGNLTAWYQKGEELNWLHDLFTPFLTTWAWLFPCEKHTLDYSMKWEVCPQEEIPKELHRYAAKFICDRGVSHELVRHRPCSFAQESTRYVNYGNKEMEFIAPDGFDDWTGLAQVCFEQACDDTKDRYRCLLIEELTPQQARAVLPNALKTEVVVTADAAEWQHIRTLRTDSAAHPDMRKIMNMMPWEEFL